MTEASFSDLMRPDTCPAQLLQPILLSLLTVEALNRFRSKFEEHIAPLRINRIFVQFLTPV